MRATDGLVRRVFFDIGLPPKIYDAFNERTMTSVIFVRPIGSVRVC